MRLEVAHRSKVRKMFRRRRCKGYGEARAVNVNANPTTVIKQYEEVQQLNLKGTYFVASNPRIYRQERDCTLYRLCFAVHIPPSFSKREQDHCTVRLRRLRQVASDHLLQQSSRKRQIFPTTSRLPTKPKRGLWLLQKSSTSASLPLTRHPLTRQRHLSFMAWIRR